MLVRRAGLRPGRIFTSIAMHLVQVLGLGVRGVEVVVADRPFGRNPTVMLHLAEILSAHAEQRCAADFRVPAEVVVNAGVKRAAVLIPPGFLGLVFVVDEDRLGAPVVLSPRQIGATL